MATDLVPDRGHVAEDRLPSAVLGGALLIAPAVLLAFLTRQVDLWLVLVAVGTAMAAAWLNGHRGFVHFFAFVMVLRPLVDLTAGPRSSGVSFTELFGAGVLLVTVGWLASRFTDLRPRLTTPLGLALLVLLAMWSCATLAAADPRDGVTTTLRLAAGVAVYFATDLLLTTRRLSPRHLGRLVLAVSVIPLAYPLLGLVGVVVTAPKDGVDALTSVFYLSNNFAYFLVPLVALGTAYTLWSEGPARLGGLAYTLVAATELVLTQTRGAWLTAVIAVLLVCLVRDRRVAAVVGAVVVVTALATPSVQARIASLVPDPNEPRTQSSLAWRVDQWSTLLPYASESPVIGHGPGAAREESGKESHNDYLKAVVETGLLGLLAYLWVLGAAIAAAWGALRVALDRRIRHGDVDPAVLALCSAVAGYSVALVVASFGDNLIDNVTFLWSTLPLFAFAQWARTGLGAPAPAPAPETQTVRD